VTNTSARPHDSAFRHDPGHEIAGEMREYVLPDKAQHMHLPPDSRRSRSRSGVAAPSSTAPNGHFVVRL
jgi:hypothetical protein